MKLKILLLTLFVAGLGASLALASPRSGGAGTTTGDGTTTAVTTGEHHGPGDHRLGPPPPPGDGTTTGDHHGPGAHKPGGPLCHMIELKGTLASSSLSLAVTGPGHEARKLTGGTVSLTVGGNASVVARVCGAPGAQTYKLRGLKVAERQPGDGTTTGTTSTTTSTGTTTTP